MLRITPARTTTPRLTKPTRRRTKRFVSLLSRTLFHTLSFTHAFLSRLGGISLGLSVSEHARLAGILWSEESVTPHTTEPHAPTGPHTTRSTSTTRTHACVCVCASSCLKIHFTVYRCAGVCVCGLCGECGVIYNWTVPALHPCVGVCSGVCDEAHELPWPLLDLCTAEALLPVALA